MRDHSRALCHILLGSAIACTPLVVGSTCATAGGLAVREQSTQFQGSSYAGNGAGGALSSSFWNSAAIGEASYGFQSESSATLLIPKMEFTTLPGTSPLIGGGGDMQTVDRKALIPASYFAYRLTDTVVLGMAINSPFGVSTEVDGTWQGRLHHRSASILTFTANPMAAFEIAPGLHVGIGAQIQYTELKLKTATAASLPAFGGNPAAPSAVLKGDDIGIGFTVGLLFKPRDTTSIGIGYRSLIGHSIKGDQTNISPNSTFTLDMDTPEMVTFSLQQALSPSMRVLATVEWTHWERFDVLPISNTTSALDLQWHDGWFFALGGEYDISDKLTLRSGAAYEISPIQNPSERPVQGPDADRIWASLGANYKYSDRITLDASYTHVFFDDSTLNRLPSNGANVPLIADVESRVNIFSLGIKMKLGGSQDSE